MAGKAATKSNGSENDFQMKEGQFMVFKNAKKEKVSQPDLWGKCMVNGKEYRVSLWVAESQSGNKYWNGQVNDYKPSGQDSDAVDL